MTSNELGPGRGNSRKLIEAARNSLGKKERKEKTREELIKIFMQKAISSVASDGFSARRGQRSSADASLEGLIGQVILSGKDKQYLITVAARIVRPSTGNGNANFVSLAITGEDAVDLLKTDSGKKRTAVVTQETSYPTRGDEISRQERSQANFYQEVKKPERHYSTGDDLSFTDSVGFLRELIDSSVDKQATNEKFEATQKDEIFAKYSPSWAAQEVFWNIDRPEEFRAFVATAQTQAA